MKTTKQNLSINTSESFASNMQGFSQNKLIYILVGTYILGVSVFMLWHRAWVSIDQFFAIAIIIALVLGRVKAFFMDWVPVVVLYCSYEYLRGVAPLLNSYVNIWPMINIDRFLFGTIPTVTLQQSLYHPGILRWYDYVLVVFYMLHFITPVITGFYFWLTNRKLFKRYTLAFILLSYAGFVTYILFPAMPPWMAAQGGHIPPVQSITQQVMANFAQPLNLPSVYSFFRSNPVAAMPSLHCAYPTLIFLFLYNRFGKKAYIILPYVLGVWFATIYLGEHYFADVAAGIWYAYATYFVVMKPKTIKRWTIALHGRLPLRLAKAQVAEELA